MHLIVFGFWCNVNKDRQLDTNGCHCVMILLYHELHKKTNKTVRKETLRDTWPPILTFIF